MKREESKWTKGMERLHKLKNKHKWSPHKFELEIDKLYDKCKRY